MTELITGAKGSAHVTSAQQRAINAYTFGTGAYILNGCVASMPSANTLHITAGYLMVQGAMVEVTATDLTIANGTQGTKRYDLACLHYALANSVETTPLTVVQGTPSENPVDPTVSGSILAGDATADIPLWRVTLDGITPTVSAIADVFTSTKALQDAISQIHIYQGTIIVTGTGTDYVSLWTTAQFAAAFPLIKTPTPSISLTNGDRDAKWVRSLLASIASSGVVAHFDAPITGDVRLNYTVIG